MLRDFFCKITPFPAVSGAQVVIGGPEYGTLHVLPDTRVESETGVATPGRCQMADQVGVHLPSLKPVINEMPDGGV